MVCVDVWENQTTGVEAPYDFRVANLLNSNNFPSVEKRDLTEGTYGATVNGTAIKLLSAPSCT